MNINLTIKATKNYQTVELSATDMVTENFDEWRDWLIAQAQIAIDELSPGENATLTATINNSSNNQTNKKSNIKMASEKQLSFLRALGYTDSVDNMTSAKANELIDKLKANKR